MIIKSSFFGLENKITSAFLIFSLLMCIIVFFTITNYNTIETEVHQMNNILVPETIALKNVESNILSMIVCTQNYLRYNNLIYLNDFQKNAHSIQREVDLYLSQNASSNEKATNLENKSNEIMVLCTNAINLKKQGENESLLNRKLDEIIKKQKKLSFDINRHIDINTEKIEIVKKQINNAYYLGKRNILLANILVLLIAMFSGLYLSKKILSPVEEMIKIARGELNKSIKINTNDEIEKLANSFNEVMRELMLSRERVQKYANKLEKEVKIQTKELNKKVENEQKTTKAMMHILVDFKNTNIKLNQKEKELETQAVELAYRTQDAEEKTGMYEIANTQLIEAQKQLRKFNSILKEKVEERTRSLRHEKEKVELLLKEKNDFIIRLSHDLRTPLTPLTTLFSILEVQIKNEKHKKYIRICNENIQYMKNLVLNTLNMARFDTNTVVLNFQPTNIKKLINTFIEANIIEYNKKNIKMINHIKNLPIISCDETRIIEVVQNICSNAIKYAPDGGTLVFDSDVHKSHITIKIKDQGIGMSEDVIQNMFVEFYRGDPSRHDLSCGLGMSISKRIIESHNGKIWAKSDGPGKGSTILFTLPVKQKKRKITNIK